MNTLIILVKLISLGLILGSIGIVGLCCAIYGIWGTMDSALGYTDEEIDERYEHLLFWKKR